MGSMINILAQYRGWKLYDLPRSVFSTIDSVIYWAIAQVYELIVDLAHVSVFSETTLNAFYSNVYALLSIFMLFKLSFSVISYILDPAKLTDKTVGFGKIITNVIIMFVMMLSAPVAFKYLTKLQNAILDDNVIENFIFSVSEDGENYTSFKVTDDATCSAWHDVYGGFNTTAGKWTTTTGNAIAIKIYRNFFNLSEDVAGYTGVFNFAKESLGGSLAFCEREYSATVSTMTYGVNDYVEKSGKGTYYVVEYRMFLSTIVGGFVLFMFISLAFDVAVRTVKLGFLQLIAPVPIMSYIDPKSGQNGMFSKWLKEVGKTWSSLFIRLFAIYFAVFIITKLEIILPSDYEQNSHTFIIELFITIGALMFAKQLPGLLEQLFPGMKMGKMQLNPLKKIGEDALGGKLIAGATGAAAAMGLGAIGGAISGATESKGVGNKFKNAFSGFAAGAINSGRAGFKNSKDGKFTPFSSALNGIQRTNERRLLGNELVEQGIVKSGPFAVERAKFKNKATDVLGRRSGTGTTDIMKDKINQLKAQQEIANDQRNQATRDINSWSNRYGNDPDALKFNDYFNRDISGVGEYTDSEGNTRYGAMWNDSLQDKSFEDFCTRMDITIPTEPGWVTEKKMVESSVTGADGKPLMLEKEVKVPPSQAAIDKYNEDLERYKKIEAMYNERYNAEKSYRDAYDKNLGIEREKTKLQKQKDKIDKAKENLKGK